MPKEFKRKLITFLAANARLPAAQYLSRSKKDSTRANCCRIPPASKIPGFRGDCAYNLPTEIPQSTEVVEDPRYRT